MSGHGSDRFCSPCFVGDANSDGDSRGARSFAGLVIAIEIPDFSPILDHPATARLVNVRGLL